MSGFTVRMIQAENMRVEIFYFSGCPNYIPAVERVRELLLQEGAVADVIEIEVKDSATAQQIGFLGSPTIRVDGQDVDTAAHNGQYLRGNVPDLRGSWPASGHSPCGID